MNAEIKHTPFPFHKIAVAIGFSPRTEAIVAEAARLLQLFNATVIFIHIGEQKEEQANLLSELLGRFGFNESNHKIIWKAGDTVEKILEACKEERVDLLVAGALEKESILKYFLGGISRTLCRRAKCSMLMLKEPDVNSKPIKHIVVEGSDHPKTATTVETAIYIGKKTNADVVHVVQEHDMAKTALIRSDAFTDDEADDHKEKIQIEEVATLNHILACTDCGTLRVQTERLEGKPGYVISNFARENKADLLVLNSPDTKLNLLDRVFPHDIEYALADLPCDLLIVHSKDDNLDF